MRKYQRTSLRVARLATEQLRYGGKNERSVTASVLVGKAKDPSTRDLFSIRVTGLRAHSLFEVIEEGMFPTSVMFHLEPPRRVGDPCDLEINLFGEKLNCALRLQKSGSAVVDVNSTWWGERWMTWREEIIDLALQQFATIPGGR
jgi:hypothetical protein